MDEDKNVLLSEWAAKRFKQIISGYGYAFLEIFGMEWESDLVALERSSRVSIKNLMECVITDIIETSGLNSE